MPSGKYEHKKYIHFKDFTNQRFGNLTAIQRIENYKEPSGKERTYWLLRCDCGNEVKRRTDALQNNKKTTQSCYSCANKNRAERAKLPRLTDEQRWENYCYNGYKQGAKRRNIAWSIPKNVFIKLSQSNCHYCNDLPNFRKVSKCKPFQAHGINRVDSNKCYTIENVVACCSICNQMKSNMTYDRFISHIIKIKDLYDQKRSKANS